MQIPFISKLIIYTSSESPLIFLLEKGEFLIGYNDECKIKLKIPEIDEFQGKISIFDYGECSYESLSNKFDDYRNFTLPFDQGDQLIKIRKNKEIDIFNNTEFYISKYKTIFSIEKNNEILSENNQINNNIDEKKEKIKNLFQKTFQKIKRELHSQKNPNLASAYQKFEEEFAPSQDAFSKFELLYESFKPLFNYDKIENNEISTNNISINENIKSYSQTTGATPLKYLEENNIFLIKKNEIIEENSNSRLSEINNDSNSLNLMNNLTINDVKNNINFKENEENKQIQIDSPKIYKSPILKPTILDNQSLKATILDTDSLKPTILESPLSLKPTILDNQSLKPTILQSQDLNPTVLQSDCIDDNNLYKENQKNNENNQKNESKSKKKISLKKRKIDNFNIEKLKNEKRLKIEKIIMEEKLNSVKLFNKDNIDDLEDLFDNPEKDSNEIEKNSENNTIDLISPESIKITSNLNENIEKIPDLKKKSTKKKQIREKEESKINFKNKNQKKLKKNFLTTSFELSDKKIEITNEEIKKDEGENIYNPFLKEKTILIKPEDNESNLTDVIPEKDEEIKKIIPKKAKLNKTLTQILNPEELNDNNYDYSISLFNIKLKKNQLDELKQLKIKIIDDIYENNPNILIVKELSLNPKIIIAINKGIDIVSTKWLDEILKEKKIIKKTSEFLIIDTELEDKYKFKLNNSLIIAKLQAGFLKDFYFWIPDKNNNATNKQIEKMIISAGGNIINSIPKGNNEKELVLADWKNKRFINNLIEDKIRFITKENLIEACLKQTFE